MARIDNLTNFLTDVATAIKKKTGKTEPLTPANFDTEIDSISGGGGGSEIKFTGHYDTEGLKTIGWTDEEINYYQQNGVQWNESEDAYFKLTDTELAGDESDSTRFLPKSSTKTSLSNYYRLLAIPLIDTSNVTSMKNMFVSCLSLTTIPQLDTSKVTNMQSMFEGCRSLTTIPLIDTSSVTTMRGMFNSCYSLTTIPQLDTSNVTDMLNMFAYCYSLTTIPQLDTSKVTNMYAMLNRCQSLKTIPQLNTSAVTSMYEMFSGCYSLTTIPQLDTSKVTNMQSMFGNCYCLKAIPLIDTSNVTGMQNMLANCYSLATMPQLDAHKANNVSSVLYGCKSLETMGGFKNLGQAYSTTKSANYTYYKLSLSDSSKLTEQSIINVLNNLYDIATKGCNTQQVVLGSTNLAKLTSTEGQAALSNATTKGWTIS